MTLKEQITEDMKAAMRAKDAARLGTIRLLLAACKQKEVDERVTLDDTAVIAIVDKMIKQRKDSVAAFLTAQRQDLVDKETAELAVLETYLPKRLDAHQVQMEIQSIIDELTTQLGHKPGAADMGKVMGMAKTRLAGKAEMSQVSSAVKTALAS